MSDLDAALDAVAKAATAAATALPGIAGVVAKIASVAFSSAAAISKAGRDPVKEITRMHSSKSGRDAVADEVADIIRERFPATTPPPNHPDSDEVYGGDEDE